MQGYKRDYQAKRRAAQRTWDRLGWRLAIALWNGTLRGSGTTTLNYSCVPIFERIPESAAADLALDRQIQNGQGPNDKDDDVEELPARHHLERPR
jgi:hypothetical protein